MLELDMKRDAVNLMMIVAVCVVAGCGKQPVAEETVAESESSVGMVESVEPTVSAETNVAEVVKPFYPEVKLPPHLEKTKHMPHGRAKGRAVEREFLKQELPKLQKQLMTESQEVGKAEKVARNADPKLGRLYKELIDKQIEYRQALEASEAYTAAKATNMKTLTRYQMLSKRQITLNKEISDDKK